MNLRENALRILRFDRPERITGGLPTWDCSYSGVNHDPLDGRYEDHPSGGKWWHDLWGIGWHARLEGVMGLAREHPLADLSRLDDYAWPNPDDPRLCRRIYDRAKEVDTEDVFLSGSHRETLWERSYNLVGMDNLMMAFTDAPDAVRRLLHGVMDFQLGMARHYVEVGVEVVGMSDDLGAQHSLLFSPAALRKFFVPEYRRLFAFYKERGVIVSFHSCGHIEPVLDVFMDLGVDVLNPVQATANDLDNVRRITQGRMALAGGVSSHTVMQGPAEAIRREARQRMGSFTQASPRTLPIACGNTGLSSCTGRSIRTSTRPRAERRKSKAGGGPRSWP